MEKNYIITLRGKICSFKYIGKRLALVFKKTDHDLFHSVESANQMISEFNGKLEFKVEPNA